MHRPWLRCLCRCYCVLMPSLRWISPLATTRRKRHQRAELTTEPSNSEHAPAKRVDNLVISLCHTQVFVCALSLRPVDCEQSECSPPLCFINDEAVHVGRAPLHR